MAVSLSQTDTLLQLVDDRVLVTASYSLAMLTLMYDCCNTALTVNSLLTL